MLNQFDLHSLVIVILTAVFIIIFFLGTKNTIFGISWKNKTFLSIFIAKEMFLYVLLGVLLLEFSPIEQFPLFYVTIETLKVTSLYVLYAIIMLFLFFSLFSRVFFRKYLMVDSLSDLCYPEIVAREKILLSSLIGSLLLLIIVLHIMGVRHAFIGSIFGDQNLLEIRMANRYGTGVPTVFMSYLTFLILMSAVFLGVVSKFISRWKKYCYLSIIMYASLLMGAKGPLLGCLLAFYLASLSQVRGIHLRKFLPRLLISFLLCLLLVFSLVKIQYPEMSSFSGYLVKRIGVGQIQGVYEQFALNLSDPSYIWHTVPFANYLVEEKVYNKDLMMNTYGSGLESGKIGVMNSLFIGEALAIGGLPLVILSPFIVGFNYIVIIVTLGSFFKHVYGIPYTRSRFVIQIFVPSYVAFTGDIAGLLFFKLNIMIVMFLVPVTFLYLIRSAMKSLSCLDLSTN